MLLVDSDDGFGDSEIACHVVSLLETVGASGVIMEDQKCPRRCGHFPGKQLLEVDEYLIKLTRVLSTRRDLFVIARTDATDEQERIDRAKAFAKCGADAILVEALPHLRLLGTSRDQFSVLSWLIKLLVGNLLLGILRLLKKWESLL